MKILSAKVDEMPITCTGCEFSYHRKVNEFDTDSELVYGCCLTGRETPLPNDDTREDDCPLTTDEQ